MKKVNSIFLIIILIEVIFTIFFYSLGLFGPYCGSPCDTYSLLNPFGRAVLNGETEMCPLICVSAPHPLFYISADLLILTIIVYALYLIVGKIRKKSSSSNI